MRKWTYELLKAEDLIIFECISGSKAYGTSTPTSDTDIRYVYIMPLDAMLGLEHPVQVSDATNDCTGYELGRFIELLATANPTVIELLGMPEEVIIHKHRIYDQILACKNFFITKQLKNSMGGYAKQQIQKAKGQDKMMNWEKERMVRKGPLDFCYIPRASGGSISFADYLLYLNEGVKTDALVMQKNFAVVPIPHMRDMYELYGSLTPDESHQSWLKGLVSETGDSNDLRVASVPIGIMAHNVLYYNKDGYSMHCKEYKKYEEWLLKRNDARWVDSQKHGQKIDGKNMMHCKRLIDMSKEIASGQGVIVRRPNAEDLLKIRRGEVNLQELLDWASAEIEVIDALFDASDLPNDVSDEFRDELLRKMRGSFYRERGWLPALA